jgi:glucose/arabinose dehydrogenase
MKKNTAIALLILLLIIAAIAIWFGLSVKTPGDKASTENAASGDPSAEGVTVVAEGLHVPWSMAFLPDGGLMVTERDGTLRVIKEGVDDI